MNVSVGEAPHNFMASHGLKLLMRGYDITSIVTGEKYPVRRGWQNDRVGIRHDTERTARGDSLSAQQVVDWSKEPSITGVGVFGRNVCGVDLDISCTIVGPKMIEFVENLVGVTVKRIGRAPRVLLVYRCDGTIRHPKTTKYVDPDDLTVDEQGIDFMSGEGRQFVAYAYHPDTKQPYHYDDGPELADVDHCNLFRITYEQCALIAAEFERLAQEAGWEPVRRTKGADGSDAPAPARDPDDTFFVEPKFGASLSDLESMLGCLNPDMDGEKFDVVIKAAYDEFDGSDDCRLALYEWAKSGVKWHRAGFDARWRRAKQGNGTGRKATLRTMQHWINNGENLHPDYEPPANEIGIPLDEAEDFGVVDEDSAAEEPKRPAFSIEDEFTFSADFSPPDWLVENYIVSGEASALYGDPGTYKSFIAVDLAYHIAAGLPWHGNDVKQGAVVYVAGEGRHGLRARSAAWRLHHGMDAAVPLGFTSGPINLSDREAIKKVIPTLDTFAKRFGGLRLIIADTLARNNTADENSNTDMSVVMANAYDIQVRYDCAVLIIHHTGTQNKDRVRGASAIHGALDSSYRLDREGPGLVKMVCTKMKDAPEPLDRWFAGEVVGQGEASSLVFTETEARSGEVSSADPVASLKGVQLALYELIERETPDDREHLSLLVLNEPADPWKEKQAVRREQLRTALKALRDKELVRVPDDGGKITTTANYEAAEGFPRQ